ncbi:MAG: peptide chain release factor N(5)-glutamine methyltransferase [Gammaproteobacteria bacterium]
MTANHTTGDLLALGTSRLAGRSDSPALDAELLLAHVLGLTRARFRSHPEDVPDAAVTNRYLGLLARRELGEPLAYIVGYRHFWTVRLAITPAVLVPRPETELLVERALALRPELTANVVDLGTGSGAIALALASERPHWNVTATDVSAEALAVARGNAITQRLERVALIRGNWLEPLMGRKFDLIVSNPPYIGAHEPEMASPALRHEPRHALTPGIDDVRANEPPDSDAPKEALQRAAALASLRMIIHSAPPHLEPGGWLLLEHGSTQAADVARELVGRGFRHVRSHRDLAGHERMTEAQWAPQPTE